MLVNLAARSHCCNWIFGKADNMVRLLQNDTVHFDKISHTIFNQATAHINFSVITLNKNCTVHLCKLILTTKHISCVYFMLQANFVTVKRRSLVKRFKL